MNRLTTIASLLPLFLFSVTLHAANPKVVFSTVEDGQDDVDPGLAEIRVGFDQAMSPQSWSVVGGGPLFPEIVGKMRWADEKTIVIPVKLQGDHEYWMSINSDTFQGFQNGKGEPAVPRPLGFRTRATTQAAEVADPLTTERNRDAIQVLRKTIDGNYAYRDRLKIDWEKAFEENRPGMEAAKTPNQFARAVAKLLRPAEDGHVSVRCGERSIWTHVNAKPPNYDFQTLRRMVPDWAEHAGGVVTGKYAEGIGYLLIPEWSAEVMKGLDEAFAAVKEAKALIVRCPHERRGR